MMTAIESPTPAEPKEHTTTLERVLAVAGWLVGGKLRPECVAAASNEWHVSRRTAQVYVARAAQRIVRATTYEDPLFAMKLSQVQRDKLHQELQELLRTGEFIPFPHWQMKVKTIQADLKLLDSRDRTAAKIAQMEQGKVAAPSPAAPSKRAANEKKILRREAPPAPPRPQIKPEPPPRPVQLPAALMAHAQAVLREGWAQPTASLSIVPDQPKGKADKEMRPAQQPPSSPAPGGISCALETNRGVKKPGPTRACNDPPGAPAGS